MSLSQPVQAGIVVAVCAARVAWSVVQERRQARRQRSEAQEAAAAARAAEYTAAKTQTDYQLVPRPPALQLLPDEVMRRPVPPMDPCGDGPIGFRSRSAA